MAHVTDIGEWAAQTLFKKPTRFVEAIMLRRHDPVLLKVPAPIYVATAGLVVTVFWLMFTIAAK